jgi:His-Xaa-Ser system protein HxsD
MELNISIDLKIYSIEAIERAAYTFTDNAYIEIKSKTDTRAEVLVSPKEGAVLTGEKLRREFLNELLHSELRCRVSANNQKIREYIVTQALLSAQPDDAVSDDAVSQAEETQAKKQDSALLESELEAEIDKLLAEAEKSDYSKDPLAIAVPWEEKYGKKTAAAGAKKGGAKAKKR